MYGDTSPVDRVLVEVLFMHLLALMLSGTSFGATLSVGTGRTYSTIQSAVDAAVDGDTVQIYAGTYYECVTVTDKTLNIVGLYGADSTVIDALGACTNTLNLVDSDVTLTTLTLQNLNARAVNVDGGTMALVDSIIQTSGSSAIRGGGLQVDGAEVTLTGSLLTGNTGYSGGAVYVTGGGVLNVEDSELSGNIAVLGAAIYLDTGAGNTEVWLDGADLSGNRASSTTTGVYLETGATLVSEDSLWGSTSSNFQIYGASEATVSLTNDDFTEGGLGLYLADATLEAVGVLFQDGTIPALYMLSGATADIRDTEFSGYTSSSSESGVVSLNTGSATIYDSVFTGNTGYSSGALYAVKADVDLRAVTFSENTSSAGKGAAVRFEPGTTTAYSLSIDEVDFIDNTAYYSGGAVYASGTAGALTITDTTFSGSTSSYGYGGAVYAPVGSLSVTDATFEGNAAKYDGGGLYTNTANTTITNSTFTDNAGGSSGKGGALYVTGANLSLSAVAVSGGSAQYGGGLYTTGSWTISDASFSDNTSTASGGAIYSYISDSTSDMSLSRATFEGNTSSGYSGSGGGLYVRGGNQFTMSAVDLTGNSAETGGGLYLYAVSVVSVQNNLFCGNKASSSGGGTYISGITGGAARNTWVNNAFIENSAYLTGGGMYVNSNYVNTRHTAFLGNKITSTSSVATGAAIYSNAYSLISYNSIFAYSTSTGSIGAAVVVPSTATFTYNDWYSNAAADVSTTSGISTSSSGNITVDPQLTAYSLDGDCTNDDLHPLTGSPLIDAGDPTYFDLDLSASDIGPYGGLGSADADVDADGYTSEVDCDDDDDEISPAADELCDGLDNDCDRTVDEGAIDATDWYPDDDGDGYGDASATPTADCDAPYGTVGNGLDCDDDDDGLSPAATETAYDGVDQDCSGADLTDVDGDGYDAVAAGGTDCDDGDPTVSPGGVEIPYDGDDQDCSGADLTDVDGDGLDGEATGGTDCDDGDDGVLGPELAYADTDGDGYGDPTASATTCLGDGWVEDTSDCDDGADDVHPGATEICDGADTDEDCDGLADDLDPGVSAAGRSSWAADDDGDGYGDLADVVEACDLPAGRVAEAVDPDEADCDDGSAAVNPGAAEICDGSDTDEDCDGLTDDLDPSATGGATGHLDRDGDGYGDAHSSSVGCDLGADYLADGSDCDDDDDAVNPGADEVCDGANTDEDCDGLADDLDRSALSSTRSTWYDDDDGDGYGDPSETTAACDLPSGAAAVAGDCDDTRSSTNPGATEICDADDTDEDCDGLADDSDGSTRPSSRSTWYTDADADGYGDPAGSSSACDAPSGAVATAGDCDDDDAGVNPGRAEVCDDGDIDEDCDGLADDDDASTLSSSATTWYTDADADGYGDDETAVVACEAPAAHSALGGDCDDGDDAYFPSAVEACDDPHDYNCDGSVGYTDGDGDGVAACEECDDGDADIFPGADERCDGVDDDCDGEVDEDDAVDATAWHADEDGDGYGDDGVLTVSCEAPDGAVADETDCDDADPATHPAAAEDCSEPIDRDCDGSVSYADADADGFADCDECDDGDGDVFPGATELCDGVDDDCDGEVDEDDAIDASIWHQDADGDGYGDPLVTSAACEAPAGFVADDTDCDDGDLTVYPGASELEDGLDNDCSGHDETWDEDGDGLDELRELLHGTDPRDPDTDDDGVSDGAEVEAGTDPTTADAVDTGDPGGDTGVPDSGDTGDTDTGDTDTGDTGDTDTGDTDTETPDPDSEGEAPTPEKEATGCGCGTAQGSPGAALILLAALTLRRRSTSNK